MSRDSVVSNPNSVAALKSVDKRGRMDKILSVLERAPYPMTDREIATSLGSYDPNYVRPRITEELQEAEKSRIVYAGDRLDQITNKHVRTVCLRSKSKEIQTRLF
jgi:ribosomal protein L28